MHLRKELNRWAYAIILFFAANTYFFNYKFPAFKFFILPLCLAFISLQFFPYFTYEKIRLHSRRLTHLSYGNELLIIFLISLFFSVLLCIYTLYETYHGRMFDSYKRYIPYVIIDTIFLGITFWNGIIRVYITGQQLRIKIRVWGIICGMIPVAHLVMLFIILSKTIYEVKIEDAKIQVNQARKDQQICKTKYPILLIHGVFFRDSKYFNYWGRIPKELTDNGAKVFYGKQESAASIEICGKQIAKRIKEIMEETGAQKVNIIAHSKGGLDSRQAICFEGMDKHVASLTTICTPHRGCIYPEKLLNKFSDKMKERISETYNKTFRKIGDKNPDFLSAVSCLTKDYCEDFNKKAIDSPLVYYASVGSKMKTAFSGHFPLTFSYPIV
ncbi:MAG: hypothetical protein K6E78_08695, partial [Treponema sp.]|nr:hypothetical protein [Treponema sp.]